MCHALCVWWDAPVFVRWYGCKPAHCARQSCSFLLQTIPRVCVVSLFFFVAAPQLLCCGFMTLGPLKAVVCSYLRGALCWRCSLLSFPSLCLSPPSSSCLPDLRSRLSSIPAIAICLRSSLCTGGGCFPFCFMLSTSLLHHRLPYPPARALATNCLASFIGSGVCRYRSSFNHVHRSSHEL